MKRSVAEETRESVSMLGSDPRPTLPLTPPERIDFTKRVRHYLDCLASLEAKKAKIAAPFNAQIAELESDRDEATFELDDEIDGTKDSIRARVLALGESVKTPWKRAIYSKGRTTWDSKRLGGYAVAHPEILEMRKVGKPSVSIRKVK